MKISAAASSSDGAEAVIPRGKHPPAHYGYHLHFDGAIQRNPGGPTGWGWALYERGKLLVEGWGGLPTLSDNTVNTAEYDGLIHGLLGLKAASPHILSRSGPVAPGVLVLGDSQLVINQVTGKWSCLLPHLKEKLVRVRALVEDLGGYRLEAAWLRRDRNTRADELSKRDRDLERITMTPPRVL